MNDKHEKDLEKLFSWGRYLYWADLLRCRYIDYENASNGSINTEDEWHLFAVTSQWLASMWVVIEGWREIGLKDNVIDSLLATEPVYYNLLRRYRNGVFHYQPKVIDERFSTFVSEGERIMLWVFALYLEFQRFLWEWPEQFMGTKEEIQELREVLTQTIGWIPTEIISTRKRAIEDLCQQAQDMVTASGDPDSAAANDLLKSVAHMRRLVNKTPDTPILNFLNSTKEIPKV